MGSPAPETFAPKPRAVHVTWAEPGSEPGGPLPVQTKPPPLTVRRSALPIVRTAVTWSAGPQTCTVPAPASRPVAWGGRTTSTRATVGGALLTSSVNVHGPGATSPLPRVVPENTCTPAPKFS